MFFGLNERMFYRVLLPTLAAFNLALGITALAGLRLNGWTDTAYVVAGAGCCVIAGALLAAGLIRGYLTRSMLRQIVMWRQFSDTVVNWIEESGMPEETVARLHRSLNQVKAEGRTNGSRVST
jgi:hypothetical protein